MNKYLITQNEANLLYDLTNQPHKIVRAPNGDLYCVLTAYNVTSNPEDKYYVYLFKSTNGGQTWTREEAASIPKSEVVSESSRTRTNYYYYPRLSLSPDGKIHVSYNKSVYINMFSERLDPVFENQARNMYGEAFFSVSPGGESYNQWGWRYFYGDNYWKINPGVAGSAKQSDGTLYPADPWCYSKAWHDFEITGTTNKRLYIHKKAECRTRRAINLLAQSTVDLQEGWNSLQLYSSTFSPTVPIKANTNFYGKGTLTLYNDCPTPDNYWRVSRADICLVIQVVDVANPNRTANIVYTHNINGGVFFEIPPAIAWEWLTEAGTQRDLWADLLTVYPTRDLYSWKLKKVYIICQTYLYLYAPGFPEEGALHICETTLDMDYIKIY